MAVLGRGSMRDKQKVYFSFAYFHDNAKGEMLYFA